MKGTKGAAAPKRDQGESSSQKKKARTGLWDGGRNQAPFQRDAGGPIAASRGKLAHHAPFEVQGLRGVAEDGVRGHPQNALFQPDAIPDKRFSKGRPPGEEHHREKQNTSGTEASRE